MVSSNDTGKEHADLVKKACEDIDPVSEYISKPKKGAVKTNEDSPLFKASQDIFKACRDLVAVHEQANGKVATQVKTQTSERRTLWKADMEQAQKVVGYGAQYGEKVVRCHIDLSSRDEDKMQPLTPPKDALSGPGQMALDMHQRSIETLLKGKSTWGEQSLLYMDKFVGIAGVLDVPAQIM